MKLVLRVGFGPRLLRLPGYGAGFDAGPVDDDETIERHGVTIVIDPYSAPYLRARRSTS